MKCFLLSSGVGGGGPRGFRSQMLTTFICYPRSLLRSVHCKFKQEAFTDGLSLFLFLVRVPLSGTFLWKKFERPFGMIEMEPELSFWFWIWRWLEPTLLPRMLISSLSLRSLLFSLCFEFWLLKTDLRLPTRFIFDTVVVVVVVVAAVVQVRFVNTANAAADVAALSVAFVGPWMRLLLLLLMLLLLELSQSKLQLSKFRLKVVETGSSTTSSPFSRSCNKRKKF